MKTSAHIIQYPVAPLPQHTSADRVLVGGCFDVLHYGHLRFLQDAKEQGSVLVVAVESDQFIRERKHREPVHTQQQRAELLAELRCVDIVLLLPFLKTDEDYYALTKYVTPQTIAITDGDNQLHNKKKHADRIGARISVVTPVVSSFSTTNILKVENKDWMNIE